MLKYLADHTKEEKASFHMPGHKGSALFERLGYGKVTADHDITEIPGADDLRHPEGIIKTITDRYARLYGGSKAFISVNGSSALIMAAVMTCVRPGHKVLAAADSHISVKNGAKLAGAESVYLKPQVLYPWGMADGETAAGKNSSQAGMLTAPGSLNGGSTDDQRTDRTGNTGCKTDCFGIPAGLSAESISKALDEYEDIDAVIVTSPNYFGIVSDVKAIAETVHQHGKILIVDQAHGAHLKMFADAGRNGAGREDMLPVPAEECGADIVIVSTHKTMASFTQTAVAGIFGSDPGCEGSCRIDTEESETDCRVDTDKYEKNLLLLESTSPSYILMESLAVSADIMEKHGKDLAASWREDLDWFYDNVKTIPGIRVLTRENIRDASGRSNVPAGKETDRCRVDGIDFDDSKIVIDFSGIKLDGKEAEEILIEKGIYPEFHAGTAVMCLTGIGSVRKDYELLLDSLEEMAVKSC